MWTGSTNYDYKKQLWERIIEISANQKDVAPTPCFAHELGHVLYTDFLALQTQMNYLERDLWYPGPPALRTSAEFANEKALWAYIKADPKNQEAVKSVSYNILNVLEDGYVENRMLAEFPGTLGFALETMRMGQLRGCPPSPR